MANRVSQRDQKIAECDAWIERELEPLGDLDQLREDIRESTGELRHALPRIQAPHPARRRQERG